MMNSLVDSPVHARAGGQVGHVSQPAFVNVVLDRVFEAMRPEVQGAAMERQRTELARLKGEIRQFTAAIAAGGQLSSLLSALQERQANHGCLQTGLRSTPTCRQAQHRGVRAADLSLDDSSSDGRRLPSLMLFSSSRTPRRQPGMFTYEAVNRARRNAQPVRFEFVAVKRARS
jgi:hypothetical protein